MLFFVFALKLLCLPFLASTVHRHESIRKQDKPCTYNGTWNRVPLTFFSSGNTTVLSFCIVELHGTANNIQVLNVGQQCIYGEFMSPETKKPT